MLELSTDLWYLPFTMGGMLMSSIIGHNTILRFMLLTAAVSPQVL